MITSSDIVYKQTKLIKQGKATLNADFENLANVFKSKFGIKPINFFYDILNHPQSKRPRLQVIFETYKDSLKFHENGDLFYDLDKENKIAKIFHEIFQGNPNYQTQNLFVISGTFQAVAREEANSNIPIGLIDNLKNELAKYNLWEIKKSFSSAICFFHTDKEVSEIKETQIVIELRDKYFKILKQFDEFNYCDINEFQIWLDSKENFVNNYASNWFYYFKDH